MTWIQSLVKSTKLLVAIEVGAIGASYLVWRRMNRNQEFRKYMHENYPSVLEGFYKTAEFSGIKDARKNDYETWGVAQSAPTASSSSPSSSSS